MPLLQDATSFRRHRVLLSLLGPLGILAAALWWVGCGGEPSPTTPADASYRVQGVVQRVAGTQRGYREIVVRHQSVADFRNREGEIVGMESMAMPFAVASALVLDDLSPQDPVRITFEVRWEGEPVLLITELEELPAGTEIDFSNPESDDAVAKPGAPVESASEGEDSEPPSDDGGAI